MGTADFSIEQFDWTVWLYFKITHVCEHIEAQEIPEIIKSIMVHTPKNWDKREKKSLFFTLYKAFFAKWTNVNLHNNFIFPTFATDKLHHLAAQSKIKT